MVRKRFSFDADEHDGDIENHPKYIPENKSPGTWVKNPVRKVKKINSIKDVTKEIEYLAAQVDIIIETLSAIRDNHQFIDEQIKFLKENRSKV